MDTIVPVLLFTSALIGAAAGLRYKVFVLVPIALMVALGSAAVLRMNDFGAGSGITTIIACLALNQATYMIVQIFAPAAHLISDDGADGVPSSGREQAVHDNHGDNGNQNRSPSSAFDSDSRQRESQQSPVGIMEEHENSQGAAVKKKRPADCA